MIFTLLRYRIADWLIAGELRAAVRAKERIESESAIMCFALTRIAHLQQVRHEIPSKDFNRVAIKIAEEALHDVETFVLSRKVLNQ